MREGAEKDGDGEKGRTRAGEIISGTGPSRVLRLPSAEVVFLRGRGVAAECGEKAYYSSSSWFSALNFAMISFMTLVGTMS